MTGELATRDAPRTPQDTDAALRSRASRLGVGLRPVVETRYPKNAPAYDLVVGCEVTGSISQADAAAEMVRRTLEPANARDIEGWLAELSVVVVRRQDDEFAEALRLEAYASRLRQYPADVARSAILGKTWKFWPAWSEVEAECERLVAPRRHMLAALENPTKPAAEIAPPPRCTPESARKIMEAAGYTPRRFEAVKARPMATDARELDAPPERAPHWSEREAPDSPRMQQLHRDRIKAGLIKPEGTQ